MAQQILQRFDQNKLSVIKIFDLVIKYCRFFDRNRGYSESKKKFPFIFRSIQAKKQTFSCVGMAQ